MPPLARVTIGAFVVGTVLLAGCTSQSPHRDTGSTPIPSSSASVSSSRRAQVSVPPVSAGTLLCDQAIDLRAHPGPLQVVLGVVALPASPKYPALQTARTGDPGVLRLFAKTGLVINAGASFRLRVPAAFSQHARIGWGSPGRPSRQVDVHGCANPGGGWLAFAGGYWIDHPACLPIVVSSHGREQTVRIGLGKPCPGQPPPAPPTES